MGFRDRAKALGVDMKEDLGSRHKEQQERKTEGSSKYGSLIIKDKLPAGRTIWKEELGEQVLEIMPWFAGNQHPKVLKDRYAFVVDVWVHMNIGVMNEQFVCPTMSWNLPCPICSYIKQNRVPKEIYKQIAPKRRCFYEVWVKTNDKEKDKGVQLWEISHASIGADLEEIAKIPGTGGTILYSHPDEGQTFAFVKKKEGSYTGSDGKEKEGIKYVGARLFPRSTPIPEHILDQTWSLDETLKTKSSWEEISEAYFGKKANESTGAAVPEQSTNTRLRPEPEADVPNTFDTPPATINTDPMKCPAGGEIGKSLGQYGKLCETCHKWEKCQTVSAELKKPDEKQTAKMTQAESPIPIPPPIPSDTTSSPRRRRMAS